MWENLDRANTEGEARRMLEKSSFSHNKLNSYILRRGENKRARNPQFPTPPPPPPPLSSSGGERNGGWGQILSTPSSADSYDGDASANFGDKGLPQKKKKMTKGTIKRLLMKRLLRRRMQAAARKKLEKKVKKNINFPSLFDKKMTLWSIMVCLWSTCEFWRNVWFWKIYLA